MSDDLVKRARDCANGIGDTKTERGDLGIFDDLADRIEELEERLKAATDDAKEAEAYAGELEAKQKKAAQYFAEIILHCANFGRGVPSIDERIIERCEDTAANAIEYLTGGKDE